MLKEAGYDRGGGTINDSQFRMMSPQIAVLLIAIAVGGYLLINNLPAARRRRAYRVAQRQAGEKYEQALQNMAETSAIDEDELARVASSVGLDDIPNVRNNASQNILKRFFDSSLSYGCIDDDANIQIQNLASTLQVAPSQDLQGLISQAVERFRLEKKTLVPVSTSYNLQRNEICYASIAAEAAEIRTRTVRVAYSGPVMRIRIAKGLSYRMGSIRAVPDRREYVQSLGKGELAITDRRVIISLPNKSIAIRLANILEVEYFSDGVKIHKTSGKPLMLTYGVNHSIGVILERCLNDGAPIS